MLDRNIPVRHIAVMNKLQAYLKEAGILQRDFARSVKLSQATISRLASGSTQPSLKVAVRIEQQTDGAVPAASWCELLCANTERPPA